MSKEDKASFDAISETIEDIRNALVELRNHLSERKHPPIWSIVCNIVEKCKTVLQKMQEFGIQF